MNDCLRKRQPESCSLHLPVKFRKTGEYLLLLLLRNADTGIRYVKTDFIRTFHMTAKTDFTCLRKFHRIMEQISQYLNNTLFLRMHHNRFQMCLTDQCHQRVLVQPHSEKPFQLPQQIIGIKLRIYKVQHAGIYLRKIKDVIYQSQ